MDSVGHSLLQVQGHVPPPHPPRKLYVNLHIKEEQRVSDSSSPLLQPSNAKKKRNSQLLYENQVQFTYEKYVNENGFLRIYCIGSEHLARLEVFDCKDSAIKGKPPLYLKPFSGVDSVELVEFQGNQCTSITLQNRKKLIFSASDNRRLFGYCKLLREMPKLVFPEEIPNYHLEQSNDPIKTGNWVVHLINEGIGPKLNLKGLHFVTIQRSNLTINIYDFYSLKCLLTWEHCNIKRAGRYFSLVFLEVGRKCQGGPGVLWMHCPGHLVAKFRESLDKFIHDNAVLNSTHQCDQQHNLVSDQAQNMDNPDNQENFVRPRTQAMSSAHAKNYKTMCCKPKRGLINHTQIPFYDQNSNQITNVPNEGACDNSEKLTLHPPKTVKQPVTTPASYTEQNPMMQSLDEVPTGEATDCTSIVGSPFCPLQDESSNVVDSDSRLHLLDNITTYSNETIGTNTRLSTEVYQEFS